MDGSINAGFALSSISLFSFWLNRRAMRDIKFCHVVFLWTIIPFASVYSQEGKISFEHFSEKEGLSSQVRSIVQDSIGFLWLATTDGLNRFDGKNFTAFRNIPGDSSSLPNNIVNQICVDHSGNIWAATNGGLCYYSHADGKFHQVEVNFSLEKIDRTRVLSISCASDSSVWFATKTHIHHWNNKSKSTSYPVPGSDEIKISYVYAAPENIIWIGASNSRIFAFNPSDKTFRSAVVSSPFSIEKKLSVNVHPIVSFRKDTVLIGTWYAGMQKVLMRGHKIICLPLADTSEGDPRKHIVTGISGGGMGSRWWVGTYGNGLAWWDEITQQFTRHFHHDPSDPSGPSDDFINDIFTDRTGIVWIGTSTGMDKYDDLSQQFQSVPIPISKNDFSVYMLPRMFTEDLSDSAHQWIWVPVSGIGLYHYNRVSNQFILYNHRNNNPYSLPDNNVYCAYYDHRGSLWIGSHSGVSKFDVVKKKFFLQKFNSSTPPVYINKIFQDRKNRYWFSSSSQGLWMYDELSGDLKEYKENEKKENTLPDNRIFCTLEDPHGNIWIGTQNRGLCRLTPQSGKMMYFLHDRSNPQSIPDNGIYDLHLENDSRLWIASENGLAVMDISNDSFSILKVYGTRDGLPSSNVFSITQDRQKHLWFATNSGVAEFNLLTKTFKSYFTSHGLPVNRISGAVYCCTDGTMLFGSTGMITYCHPDKMRMNNFIPPVVITSVKVLDQDYPFIRSETKIEPIHLTYKQNVITIEFAALNFTNAGLNRYAYKMEGFDREWIYGGSRNLATYTNLDGGKYLFRVKAANNDGIWNETGTSISLVIAPPYWKTWWFYVLCFIVVAAILYGWYRMRISQLIRLQRIRQRIARDLHDDIGSTLSSISMMSRMAAADKKQVQDSSKLLHTISSASTQAMELMTDIVWSVNPDNDRFENVLARMREYASEILDAAGIEFTFESVDSAAGIMFPPEKRKDFFLIFKEAVNNLAKYSGASRAAISISVRHRKILLNVNDNGKGFDPSGVFPGNGLKNMKARAQSMKAQFNLLSSSGNGTQLSLIVPVVP